jgi:hypothetical protein
MVLALYSINCTTAGQYWDQQTKNQEAKTDMNKKQNQQVLIDMYRENIKIAENEFSKLNDIKYSSLDDMGDRYYYKNTTKMIEDKQAELKIIISENQEKFELILSKNKISAKQDDIKQSKQLYEFYANFINKPGLTSEHVQFVFQILLSILIELIAQVSIYIFMQINESDKIKQMVFTREEIKQFTRIAFKDIIDNGKKYFLDRDTIMQLMNGFNLDKKKYKHIIRVATKSRLIVREKKKYKPANEFIDRQIFLDNMCEKLGIGLDLS